MACDVMRFQRPLSKGLRAEVGTSSEKEPAEQAHPPSRSYVMFWRKRGGFFLCPFGNVLSAFVHLPVGGVFLSGTTSRDARTGCCGRLVFRLYAIGPRIIIRNSSLE